MNPTPIEPAGLRARLLEVEPPDGARLDQLRQEIATMFVQTLSRTDRTAWTATLILALAMTAFGGYVTARINVPPSIGSQAILRAVWALFTAASFASVAYAALVLWKGAVDQRHRVHRSRFRVTITLAIAVLLILQSVANPTIPMLGWALFGLLWAVAGVANGVMDRIAASELTVRESMLRLELRLAESAERR